MRERCSKEPCCGSRARGARDRGPAPPQAGAPVRPFPFLLWVLAALAVAGCGRERAGDPALSIEVHVSPTPAAVGPARVMVDVTDAAGAPIEGARVTVAARSEDGGAVVVESARAEGAEGTGRYTVPALPFGARGEWTLTVRAEVPDGRWAEVEHPVRVMGGSAG